MLGRHVTEHRLLMSTLYVIFCNADLLFVFGCVSFLAAACLGLCVSSDRNPAMEYTEKLPVEIDPEMWLTHDWNLQQCMERARCRESEEWCQQRAEPPPRTAQGLLSQLRESDALWLGLRRHLGVSEATFILRVLAEHSEWREVKRTDNERNRKAYHKLCDDCRHITYLSIH